MGGCGGVKFKISGGFLHTNYTEGDTHVFIKGKIIELLAHIYPKMNQDYIITKNIGQRVLYEDTLEEIYSNVNESLMLWTDISGSVEKMGFGINRYRWYYTNKN